MAEVEVRVSTPAAWFWLPLDASVVVDPDVDDDPPRYSGGPEGGWEPIGQAVIAVLKTLERRALDVLEFASFERVSAELTRDQEWIVYGWFGEAEAPLLNPRSDGWINGRHRTWGLRAGGFDVAPVLHIPMTDAISLWDADPADRPPLDEESLADQRRELGWWRGSRDAAPLRAANPDLGDRWARILDRWEARINFS